MINSASSVAVPPHCRRTVPVSKTTAVILRFGLLHIIFGAITLIFGAIIVGKLKLTEINDHSTAIWCSVIFVITGILGTIIKCKPHNKPLVVAHNVFAILSIFFAIAVLIAGAFGTHHYDCKSYRYPDSYHYPYSYIVWRPRECRNKIDRNFGRPAYICLIVIGFLEMTFAIISTIFSFRLFNCCTTADCCGNNCCDNERYSTQSGNQQIYMQPYQLASQPEPIHPQPIVQPLHNVNETPQTTGQPFIVTNHVGKQFYLLPILTSSQMALTSPFSTQAANPPPYQQ